MFGQLHIDEIYAFVAVDDDGTEGVVAVGSIPLVGADMRRVTQLVPVAKQIASISGKAVEVVKFSERTSVRTIAPGKMPTKKPPKRLEDKLTEAVGQQHQMEMRMYDEPELASDVAVVEGVKVHATIIDGQPAVAFVFLDENGKELPTIAVHGTTAKDVGPLAAAAFDMAVKSQN